MKNCDTPPSSFIHKNFDTRSFLKHRLVPLQNFWTLWDKKLIAENSYIPFLCVNFFHNRLFLKRRRILLRVFLVLWDKKTETNLWNNPSSLIHWNFWYQNFFWNTERFFYEMFQYGETKQFVRKIVIPTHCLILNIFRYQKFSKTQTCSPTNFLDSVGQQTSSRKQWYPHLMREFFL